MAFLPRDNDALNINPAIGVDEILSEHGSDFLWAVMAIYGVSFVSPHSPSTDHVYLEEDEAEAHKH